MRLARTKFLLTLTVAILAAFSAAIATTNQARAVTAPPTCESILKAPDISKSDFDALKRSASTSRLSTDVRLRISKSEAGRCLTDPTATQVSQTPGPSSSSPSAAATSNQRAAASRCGVLDRYVVFRSFTHGKTGEYHFITYRCWNGSKVWGVRGWHKYKSFTYFTYDKPMSLNAQYRVSTGNIRVEQKGRIEQCFIKYGCIFYDEAYANWNLYGSGKYAIKHGRT